jgi:hypothetical protein
MDLQSPKLKEPFGRVEAPVSPAGRTAGARSCRAQGAALLVFIEDKGLHGNVFPRFLPTPASGWRATVADIANGSGPHQSAAPKASVASCGGEGGIIGIARSAAAIDRGRIDLRQRCAGLQPLHKVGIGDERPAEGEQVRLALGEP